MAYVTQGSVGSLWDQGGYQENLRFLQGAADELLGHMKGHGFSFRREITDGKEAFSQEKLQGLVEEMLSLWEEYHQANLLPAYTDAGLQERRELYGLYLYLVMRCSLEKGAYRDARGGADLKERTDFAFLLRQAKQLIQDWYAVPEPDGGLRNEVDGGYDAHFGFHIYYALNDPDVPRGHINPGNDYSLTPDWKIDQALRRGAVRFQTAGAEEAEEAAPPDNEDALCEAGDDGCGPFINDGLEGDGLDFLEDDDGLDFLDGESNYDYLEWLGEKDEGAQGLTLLATRFECPEEYRTACERFVELFAKAPPEVPRDFCADLEKIVDLYLIQRGIPPLMDKDKTLDVYNCLYDGALRQAARYGRGIQWKGL